MGYSVYCEGMVTLPAAAAHMVLVDLLGEGEAADSASAATQPLGEVADKILDAICEALGTEGECSATLEEGEVKMFLSGRGKLRDEPETVLGVIAIHGGTGSIEATGDDDCRWRYRLEDGAVHDDPARTVYAGDVDTEGWIAQLQSPDDYGFDHVAVLPTEAAARAQIAVWCREDYRAYADEVPSCGPRIDDDTDDDTVIERWTGPLGGVRYRVVRVGVAVDPAH